MAVTAAFNASKPQHEVVAPPYAYTDTVPDGQSLIVQLLNVAQLVQITSTVAAKLYFSAAAIGGKAYYPILANTPMALYLQVKQLWIRNDSGGPGVIGVLPTLTQIESETWPTLSEAEGFDGIQSHYSAAVA